uniref:Photosystem I protein M n=1 Tax=Haplomitrium blumei TaxID=258993 RepID=A0A4Y5P7K9_9MARC|nr:photosystem I protein M [Haplomitrium blumei]QCW59324.1 photosystem I protein M [Haplomitrium blumei]
MNSIPGGQIVVIPVIASVADLIAPGSGKGLYHGVFIIPKGNSLASFLY